ncbi:hypothetical protein T12_8007 [Trichinella patagoniensis]|uniref:Uncharacterized protein n=1 Tax=Trichinella patagoniensis TaxID=990121 RepID=A0A0V0ZHS6_9BILA|nr:hypothetical protein T12_8007 [Trichinella patagoniensis]
MMGIMTIIMGSGLTTLVTKSFSSMELWKQSRLTDQQRVNKIDITSATTRFEVRLASRCWRSIRMRLSVQLISPLYYYSM